MTIDSAASQPRSSSQAETKKYVLDGTMLEACNCNVLCPCWIGENPDHGTCDAINAYHIDQGTIGELDVSGLTVVGIDRIPGNALAGNWREVLLIDDRATHDQLVALEDAFTGQLGGPLGDLAGLVGQRDGVYGASIEYALVEGTGAFTVVGKARAHTVPYRSEYGTVTTLRDSIFSTIPGSPAWVAKATECEVNLPEHDMVWRFENSNAIQGTFHFEA